jgi:phage FluMu gp28-like protein
MIKQITYTRPVLFQYQTDILNSSARFTVTVAATKVGKTASHIVWLFEQALICKKNQSVWWIAPTFGQAKIAYNRMKVQISNRNFFTANETNLVITLITGAKIEFKTGEKPDNLYGDDVYAFVFDEFTRAREAAWFALRSTITSTGGKGKFIGNARGNKNWGYKLAMRAKGGQEADYAYFKITAYDAAASGMKTKDGRPFIEEIEAAKRDLPVNIFGELYLAEASEDGSNPFGLKYIAACCVPALSGQESICYGIDLARKIDFVSIIGLDKLGSMSHYHNFTKVGWQQTIATIKYLKNKPMAIDSTGVGDVVISDAEQVQTQIEPYIFTQASKQRLMEGLAIGIQSRKILIADDGNVVNGTGKIRHQLEQFEVEYTRSGVKYSAPEGEHDDDVCALALAWHKWQSAAKSDVNISVW